MKTRNGFVSNSSSTSFVVVLPDCLKVFKDKDTQDAYEQLVANGEFAQYSDYVRFDLLSSALQKYCIAEFDVGDEQGIIISADKNKIRKILQQK